MQIVKTQQDATLTLALEGRLDTLTSSQGSMVIKNAGPEIREIFDVTGFSDILTLE